MALFGGSIKSFSSRRKYPLARGFASYTGNPGNNKMGSFVIVKVMMSIASELG